MNIAFYGGVNEVGGNKIFLEDRGTRIFLDFGFSFSKNKLFYSEFLQPRLCNGIGDFLELGIIPDLKGIYRNDLLRNEKRETSKYPTINGVLLSHAHADHAWNISLLHEEMPIYCGVTTKTILKAAQESGMMPYYGDFYWFKENFVSRGKKPEHVRNFKTFATGDKVRVGSLEVEPIHIDHSIPGAYAFIIYTTSGSVVYSGDLRMHGPKSNFTLEFIDRAREAEPEIMICEGTRVNEKERGLSEEDVFKKIKDYTRVAKKLVIVNFPIRDIDRFKSFYLAAKECGRRLAINFKQAYLLSLLKIHDPRLELPELDDDSLAIYVHRSKWGRFDEDDYSGWERQFLRCKNTVTFEDLHKNQDEFIFYCDYYSLNELLDVKPEKGSIYIYSISEPHDEEEEIDFKRMKNWLNHFSLPLLEAHASGHMCQNEIREMIEGIKPKVVMPVHTEHPALFKKFFDRVILPEYGKNFRFD